MTPYCNCRDAYLFNKLAVTRNVEYEFANPVPTVCSTTKPGQCKYCEYFVHWKSDRPSLQKVNNGIGTYYVIAGEWVRIDELDYTEVTYSVGRP